MRCTCCSEIRDTGAALKCDPQTWICRDCIGWLNGQANGVDVTPTLPIRDMDEAEHVCKLAGLTVHRYDDGFAFVHRDGQSVFDLDRIPDLDPAANHAGCYIIVNDVDEWHAEMVTAGLPVTPVVDQPWGMHEFSWTGPAGANIRIGRSTGD